MQKLSNSYWFSLLPLLIVSGYYAQKDAQHIYDGNKLYYNGNLSGSQAKYSKALELNPSNRKANFNLGNALYRNAQLIKSGQLQLPEGSKITPDSLSKMVYDQAAQNFAVVANSISNKDTLHKAWHNIGNCYLQKKDYQQAVDAYKKALKFDSKDEETRYNLAYALKNLPKEQKKGGGGQKPQDQKKEDKNDKDKNSQPQPGKMSKEQAEQLLKALMESEKKLQDKRKQKAENPNHDVEKDW
jgi:Ca-activated chloride channel homolog